MNHYALVTGSAGAIGSAIVKALKNNGYKICGLNITHESDKFSDHFIEIDLDHPVTFHRLSERRIP